MKIWIVLALVMFAVVILLKIVTNLKGSGRVGYRKRKYLFTKLEKTAFFQLKKIIGDDFVILAKVRVADVLEPNMIVRNKKDWWQAFSKISQKHFDFVLCDPKTLLPLVAIELDDASHSRSANKKNDMQKNFACESSEFPLIRLTPDQMSNLRNVKNEIFLRIGHDTYNENQ